jgi:hypothetical protein
MIRKDFFQDSSYKIELKNEQDVQAEQDGALESNKTLVEFCLPFTELKHIVEGMVEDDSTTIELEYPVGDNYLQIRIPDEPRGGGQIFRSETCLKLETYEA